MEQPAHQTFRATLRPYRSLSRKGFLILMSVLIGLNFAAGTAFYLLGAWPVAPFLGLDVALVWWAFRKNYADALKEEQIEVTAHELILRRFDHDRQREELHFTRAWVRVELEEDKDRELIGSLFLRFKGQRTEIGRFLGAHDRKEFAATLRGALAQPRV
ncbi:DUF2244 domain-containing protein [Nordella sp. HKS 07]|uniref:DUF2244 domain-containing protein n=1 Tax=Nordella sp. HKS 07 TaxID=2712222 RepID=UPI0013E1D732|nr:DUF2244 domain-containing protein [Nordella sp. HKS 07]QIG48791.1 DUF2244 domain-containing protein [Nordella sp. HKS 07]